MKVNFKDDAKWKGSVKYYILSFSYNDKEILNIDRAGRVISFISIDSTTKKTTYKKAFDGSWLGIERANGIAPRTRFYLSNNQIESVYQKIDSFKLILIEKLTQFQNIEVSFDPSDVYSAKPSQSTIEFWISVLRNVAIQQNNDDRTKFHSIYSNVSILPPDRYGSLVLQVTTGCIYNKCSFCTLYAGIPYIHKSPSEFEGHINDVTSFMSESLGRFHSIFIGDANALTVPFKDLIEIFKIINKRFKIKESKSSYIQKKEPIFEGVFSFLDVFTGFKLTTEHFRELASMNLRMVYLGIETGSQKVLKLLNKPNTKPKIIQIIKSLHETDIGVAVIFLIGAGGKQFEEDHIIESIKLIQEMNLNTKDIVYFSKLVITGNYKNAIEENNIKSLTEQELEDQLKVFKRKLDNYYKIRETKPITTRYELLDFIY